jgi:hypothetical protein
MSELPFPELPEVADHQRGERDLGVRYEDLTQDSRLRLEGVWPAMGRILWTDLPVAQSLGRLAAQGIRNVLARVLMQCENEPLTARLPAKSEVRYELAHTVDAEGRPNRRLLLTHLRTLGWRGTPDNPVALPTGDRVLAARAYGMHVFTRPTARGGDHRVLELHDEVLGDELGPRVELPAPQELLELPAGATWIEPAPTPDPAPTVFGLSHTDGNQHVNFQAYPRLVEDAALRRLHALHLGGRWLGRRLEVAYRKPCFAGERMQIVVRAFERGEARGVVAAFAEPNARAADDWAAWGKPRCTVRMLLLP